ncbi:erythroblast NAD(P)(+)--arginine ADP-ribosyltransferase-like [Cyprinodon tularosa]|uniref:erythroblast NAD(P)(+)--arginine ADP-ribosyltransferase-like n=1 Tax=Cyprinodon tularosa TaxID=77115 RepID=UPI0018E1E20A|nr:erythroblast NAD(P)(+)--arginine ADP-ribosyltransferase-like [Cyprinodon tularosa]
MIARMNTKLFILGSLCLLLCCKLQKIVGEEDQSDPLDMAEESVDDRYSTCVTKMEEKVKNIYFKNEAKNTLFGEVWKKAENCAQRNLKEREKGDEALTKDHMQAICLYTAGGKENFYKIFNNAVKTMRNYYGSSFQFHSLHFWLTRAIQILKQPGCHITYRRTKTKFTGDVNKEIRFGTFTSSSNLSNLTNFGKKTCFKIETCYGAFLKKYPKLKDHEKEWLIPPYEKFKITSKGKTEGLFDCENVYTLKSTGVLSNLDCSISHL